MYIYINTYTCFESFRVFREASHPQVLLIFLATDKQSCQNLGAEQLPRSRKQEVSPLARRRAKGVDERASSWYFSPFFEARGEEPRNGVELNNWSYTFERLHSIRWHFLESILAHLGQERKTQTRNGNTCTKIGRSQADITDHQSQFELIRCLPQIWGGCMA